MHISVDAAVHRLEEAINHVQAAPPDSQCKKREKNGIIIIWDL